MVGSSGAIQPVTLTRTLFVLRSDSSLEEPLQSPEVTLMLWQDARLILGVRGWLLWFLAKISRALPKVAAMKYWQAEGYITSAKCMDVRRLMRGVV